MTLLVLVLAPLSFNYSYVWLVFPLTLLMHFGMTSPAGSPLRRWSVLSIAACVVLLSLAFPGGARRRRMATSSSAGSHS